MYALYPPESTTVKLFAQVSQNGKITEQDRYLLMQAFLNNSLTQEEEVLIDRLHYAMRRGKLEMVN